MSLEERTAQCGGRLSVPLLLFSALTRFSPGLSIFSLLIYKTPWSCLVLQWLGLGDFTVVAWIWSLVGNEDPASTARPNKQKQPPTTNLFIINRVWLSLNFSVSKPPTVSVSEETRQKSRVGSTGFAVGCSWLLLLVWPLGPHADFLPLWEQDSNTILTGLWRLSQTIHRNFFIFHLAWISAKLVSQTRWSDSSKTLLVVPGPEAAFLPQDY